MNFIHTQGLRRSIQTSLSKAAAVILVQLLNGQDAPQFSLEKLDAWMEVYEWLSVYRCILLKRYIASILRCGIHIGRVHPFFAFMLVNTIDCMDAYFEADARPGGELEKVTDVYGRSAPWRMRARVLCDTRMSPEPLFWSSRHGASR